jgi:hypothetical protein
MLAPRLSTSVLERQRHPCAVCPDLAVLNRHILLYDLRDAQITQRTGRGFHRIFAASSQDFVLVPITSTTL